MKSIFHFLYTGWTNKSAQSVSEKLILRSTRGEGKQLKTKDLVRCMVLINAPDASAKWIEEGLFKLGETFEELAEKSMHIMTGVFEFVKPSEVSRQFYDDGESVMAQYQILLSGNIIGIEIAVLSSIQQAKKYMQSTNSYHSMKADVLAQYEANADASEVARLHESSKALVSAAKNLFKDTKTGQLKTEHGAVAIQGLLIDAIPITLGRTNLRDITLGSLQRIH